jgi:hypothetical protein
MTLARPLSQSSFVASNTSLVNILFPKEIARTKGELSPSVRSREGRGFGLAPNLWVHFNRPWKGDFAMIQDSALRASLHPLQPFDDLVVGGTADSTESRSATSAGLRQAVYGEGIVAWAGGLE